MGKRRVRALRAGGSSGAFRASSGGGGRAAWEEERPGKGGTETEDGHLESPEPWRAGTSEAEAGTPALARDHRGPRAPCPDPPAGSGHRRAPTLASASVHVPRESLEGGRKRD